MSKERVVTPEYTTEQILEVAKLIYPDAWIYDAYIYYTCLGQLTKFNHYSSETCVKLMEWGRKQPVFFLNLVIAELKKDHVNTIPQAVFACAIKIVESRK